MAKNIYIKFYLRKLWLSFFFGLFIIPLLLCAGCNDRQHRKISKLVGTEIKAPDPHCVEAKKDLKIPKNLQRRDRNVKLLNEKRKEECLKCSDY